MKAHKNKTKKRAFNVLKYNPIPIPNSLRASAGELKKS